LDFPSPITTSFLWASLSRFCFLSISHNSHGLTTSIFGASSSRLLSLGPLIILMGMLTIIPAILAQLSLFYYSLFPSFLYCWASSVIGPFCQKWTSTISKNKKEEKVGD